MSPLKVFGAVLLAVFICGALVAGCFAAVNDEDSLGHLQMVSHDYCAADHDGCGSDGNSGGTYEGGESGDMDQDGENNCRNFCFYGVPIPGQDQPQSQSLFPVPTPDGVRQFVLSTIEAGIGLGRLFANATIDFVSSIMVGVA